MLKYIQAIQIIGALELIKNPLWNIPMDGSEISYEMEYEIDGDKQTSKSIKGLVMDLKNRIYGVRRMSRLVYSGNQTEGYISLDGVKYSAFTGGCSHFRRRDDTYVDVATLIVRGINESRIIEVKPL